MLVLCRKQGSRLYIGDDICITIVGVKHNGDVKVGIEANRNVPVVREEAKKKYREQRARLTTG